MLNKLKTLNYTFNEDGNVQSIVVGFSDYQGEVNGNLNVTLTSKDGELVTMTPADLQALARTKAIEKLTEE